MNIYLLTQDQNSGYDTYDSCVVISASEELARCINPSYSEWGKPWSSWAESPKDVSVTYIGTTDESSLNEGDIICSSFNAG